MPNEPLTFYYTFKQSTKQYVITIPKKVIRLMSNGEYVIYLKKIEVDNDRA